MDAILLGILEGLTEFLPVSSTGHLILLSDRLGNGSEAHKTLDIVIQLGAVLAVALYYRARLAWLARGIVSRDPKSLRLALALAIAFMPAAVIGLLFHAWIKERLFGSVPVAWGLIAGGIVMVGVELFRKRTGAEGEDDLEAVTPRRALVIGLAQAFSLWPGASRSMTSIVGGQLAGLSTRAAAEFSFLLAIPTLGAATLYDFAKNGRALLAAPGGPLALALGLTAAFAVSLLVITAFLRYLRRIGLAPFGVYRVALGLVVLAFFSGAPSHPPLPSARPAEAPAAHAAPRALVYRRAPCPTRSTPPHAG